LLNLNASAVRIAYDQARAPGTLSNRIMVEAGFDQLVRKRAKVLDGETDARAVRTGGTGGIELEDEPPFSCGSASARSPCACCENANPRDS
jgi:hypothetical protein